VTRQWQRGGGARFQCVRVHHPPHLFERGAVLGPELDEAAADDVLGCVGLRRADRADRDHWSDAAAERRGLRLAPGEDVEDLLRLLGLQHGVAQFGVLALNAVSRQVVQNLQLRGFVDVTSEPVTLQWSPLLSFLGLFVAGLAVMAWMLSRVIAAARRAPAPAR
jgi:hypothetical protein